MIWFPNLITCSQFISSSIFELVSGGAALSDYIQEGGDQDQPLQFSSDTLGTQQPPSPAYHQLHDKMDRHESSLQYIGGYPKLSQTFGIYFEKFRIPWTLYGMSTLTMISIQHS